MPPITRRWALTMPAVKLHTSKIQIGGYMGAGRVATRMDALMLVSIASETTPTADLPIKSGTDVALELNGRPLLRYMDRFQAHESGRTFETFVCPTPYTPWEVMRFLAPPRPDLPRDYVLFLDPKEIVEIQGPRWCNLGGGIEYVLPIGYPPTAIIGPGWAVEVG